MLFYPARGRKVPHDLQVSLLPLNFDEPRRAAWLVDEMNAPRYPQPSRRPHRGQLPDIDPAMLVPDPDHVPLLARLANLLRSLAAGLDRLAGTSRQHLGEST